MSEFNICKIVKNLLPRGAGIDAEWSMSVGKNGKIYASNSYHAMNEYGMYVAWIDFTLTLRFLHSEDPEVTEYFHPHKEGRLKLERINWHGQLDERIRYLYGLNDYIWQTVDIALSDY